MDALDALLDEYAIGTETTTDAELEALASTNTILDLTRFPTLSSSKLAYATEYGATLSTLTAVDTSLSEDELTTLLPLLPALTSADFSQTKSTSDVVLLTLSQAAPSLSLLSLDACSAISDAGIAIPALTLSSLTSLSLTACTNLSDHALASLAQAECLPSLTHLSLAYSTAYSEQALIDLLHGASGLRSLNLALVAAVTDDVVACVARSAKDLQDLNLASCLLLTDRSIELLCGAGDASDDGDEDQDEDEEAGGVAESLATLNCASLPGITDWGLSLLESEFPSLTDLNLQLCQGITPLGAESLFKNATHITSLKF